MIKFAVKAGLAASAIYYVREQGIWKNSDEAIATSKRLRSALNPYIKELRTFIPVELPEMPETKNVCQLAKESWNLGVRATFSFLIQSPEYCRTYAGKGIDVLLENPEIKNFVTSFSRSSSPEPAAK